MKVFLLLFLQKKKCLLIIDPVWEIGTRIAQERCGHRFLLRFGVEFVRKTVMDPSVSPFLSLFAVIRDVRGSVGAWRIRGLLSEALGWLLHRRLGEICRRLEGLAARFEAGTLRRREGSAPRVRVEGRAVRGVGEARIWPRDFGWLVKAASWQAAGFGSQVRAVLETPEMVALLTACPQAGRVLAPLCRALAIEGSVLRPRLAPEAVVVEQVQRVRTPRQKPDLGRVPIPRAVMSAVRRGRYGVM
jgi:hypothetical protein